MLRLNITEEADVSFIKYILSSCRQWEQYLCTKRGLTATPRTVVLSALVAPADREWLPGNGSGLDMVLGSRYSTEPECGCDQENTTALAKILGGRALVASLHIGVEQR